MTGFFMIKKECIQNVDLNPKGFKILLELLIKSKYATAIEIPITFKRRIGVSKDYFRDVKKIMVYIISKSGHRKKQKFDRFVSLNNFVNKELRGRGDGEVRDFKEWSNSKKSNNALGNGRNGLKMKERDEMIKDLRKKEIIK